MSGADRRERLVGGEQVFDVRFRCWSEVCQDGQREARHGSVLLSYHTPPQQQHHQHEGEWPAVTASSQTCDMSMLGERVCRLQPGGLHWAQLRGVRAGAVRPRGGGGSLPSLRQAAARQLSLQAGPQEARQVSGRSGGRLNILTLYFLQLHQHQHRLRGAEETRPDISL